MADKYETKSIRGISKKAWIEFEEIRKHLHLSQANTFARLVEISKAHIYGATKTNTNQVGNDQQIAILKTEFLEHIDRLHADLLSLAKDNEALKESKQRHRAEINELVKLTKAQAKVIDEHQAVVDRLKNNMLTRFVAGDR